MFTNKKSTRFDSPEAATRRGERNFHRRDVHQHSPTPLHLHLHIADRIHYYPHIMLFSSALVAKSSVYTIALVLGCLTVAAVAMSSTSGPNNKKDDKDRPAACSTTDISVSFLGNSILYFHDCPRLVENMLQTRFRNVRQDSCLRGGSSLSSLVAQGNGMRDKFTTLPAARPDGSHDIGSPTIHDLLSKSRWDFVVMNDFTQGPARDESKNTTLLALREQYAPLLQAAGATPVLLQTFAYKYPAMRGTSDLGTFADFSVRLQAGYDEYAALLTQLLGNQKPCLIARAGEAFLWLYQNNHHDLWEKMYSWDDFHPSPHGTWLEACCIYCAIVQEEPPVLDSQWWESARRMQPPQEKPLPLPTAQEAEELRRVACLVSGIVSTTSNNY